MVPVEFGSSWFLAPWLVLSLALRWHSPPVDGGQRRSITDTDEQAHRHRNVRIFSAQCICNWDRAAQFTFLLRPSQKGARRSFFSRQIPCSDLVLRTATGSLPRRCPSSFPGSTSQRPVAQCRFTREGDGHGYGEGHGTRRQASQGHDSRPKRSDGRTVRGALACAPRRRRVPGLQAALRTRGGGRSTRPPPPVGRAARLTLATRRQRSPLPRVRRGAALEASDRPWAGHDVGRAPAVPLSDVAHGLGERAQDPRLRASSDGSSDGRSSTHHPASNGGVPRHHRLPSRA